MNLTRNGRRQQYFCLALWMVCAACAAVPANAVAGSENLQLMRSVDYPAASAQGAIDSEQDAKAESETASAQKQEAARDQSSHDRHIYGILPNLRAASQDEPFQPMTSK